MPDRITQTQVNQTASAACDTFRGVVDAGQYQGSHLQNPDGTSRAKFSDLIVGDVSALDTSSGHLQHFSAATIQRQ